MTPFFAIQLFAAVFFADTIFAADTSCEFCLGPSEDSLKNMSLRLYNGETLNDWKNVPITNSTELLDDMDLNKPTVIYIHGWSEGPDSTSVVTIIGAYLERADHNVLLLLYEQLSGQSYPATVFSADGVGSTVGKAIDRMVACGLNSSSLHIVGHSLGAQVAGFIGKSVKCPLARITGLDPAGPGFDQLNIALTPSSAQFVDVIHTDARFYGSEKSTGHFDSFPNRGTRIQPGCPEFRAFFSNEDFCDHHRSWYYYGESLLNGEAFIGVVCDSYDSFKKGSCKSNERVVVGYGTPTTARGSVYFQTNNATPFGREHSGTTYSPTGFSLISALSSASLIPFGR